MAAFFACEKAAEDGAVTENAAVFAMDPILLNKEAGIGHFPMTWSQNRVLQTIKYAFGTQDELVDGKEIRCLKLPSAIYPSTIHARIASQRGCFTLHGTDKRDFECIFNGRRLLQDRRLIKYRIPKENVRDVFRRVWALGITYATLFPDLDGLAKELKYSFGIRR